jgi:hypothetical protein
MNKILAIDVNILRISLNLNNPDNNVMNINL